MFGPFKAGQAVGRDGQIPNSSPQYQSDSCGWPGAVHLPFAICHLPFAMRPRPLSSAHAPMPMLILMPCLLQWVRCVSVNLGKVGAIPLTVVSQVLFRSGSRLDPAAGRPSRPVPRRGRSFESSPFRQGEVQRPRIPSDMIMWMESTMIPGMMAETILIGGFNLPPIRSGKPPA